MTGRTRPTPLLVSRRAALASASAVALAAMLGPAMARGGDVSVDALMRPMELEDLVYGNKDAKVTVVEYASLTCGHCANFHNKVFPELKKKYIDTGKIRFVFRDFPFDQLAAAGSMLARCAGPGKELAMLGVLFEKQDTWVVRNPIPKLFEIAKQAGFTQAKFDACLKDQGLLDKISAVRNRAAKEFKVDSTPTFFINGKRLDGRSDMISTFDKALEPLLKGA
ncbi:MAG: DsbA family protein [Hyphomicrobiaceae bacterium]